MCLRRAKKGSLRGKEGAGQGAGLSSCGLGEPMQMRLMPYPRSSPGQQGSLCWVQIRVAYPCSLREGASKKHPGSEQTKAVCPAPLAGTGPRRPWDWASFLPLFFFKLIKSGEFLHPETEAHVRVCLPRPVVTRILKGQSVKLKRSGPE